MFGLNKYLLMGSAAVILSMSATIAYFKYSADKYRVEAIHNNLAYESAVGALKYYGEEISKRSTEIKGLNDVFTKLEGESHEAKSIFRRHNFAKLVKDNPTLMESRINNASDRLLEGFSAIFAGTSSGDTPRTSETKAPAIITD